MSDDRMKRGTSQLQAAGVRLTDAFERGDHDAIGTALRDYREGLAQFESGFAAHRMLLAGNAPQAAALSWFRSQTGLPDVPAAPVDRSWFHFILIALFAGFGTTMLVLHVQRVRRAEALLGRAAPSKGAPAQAQASASPVPSTQAAGTPAGPSRPNSWSGQLRVARIFVETADVKTFRLVDPAGGALPFAYLPGQFLTLAVDVTGKKAKRSYTMASSPARSDYCEITVRREAQGAVSAHLHDRVREGDFLQVTAPSGKFSFTGEDRDSIVLIGGGVGVTPMMSVLRYLTDRSWQGEIFFVYGSKSDENVIYRNEIEYLKARHPNVRAVLVAEKSDPRRWPHETGFITRELLARAVPDIAGRHVHLCGPPPMMSAVRTALQELGVPAGQIETEVFTGKERPLAAPAVPSTIAPSAVVTFVRSNRSVPLPPDRTILEAAEEAGVDIDYSCRSGVCGACKVKLLAGSVAMEVEDALTPDDRLQGLILACQARASSPVSVDV
jgi:ferredoxin-NADP reductase